MKLLIEKIYKLVFEDTENQEPVPYKHKRIVVTISMILSLVVAGLIIKEIIKNAQAIP